MFGFGVHEFMTLLEFDGACKMKRQWSMLISAVFIFPTFAFADLTYEQRQEEKAKEYIGKTYWVCKGSSFFQLTPDPREDKSKTIEQQVVSVTIHELIPPPHKDISSKILQLQYETGEIGYISLASFIALSPYIVSGKADQDCLVTGKTGHIFEINPIQSEDACKQVKKDALDKELKDKRVLLNTSIWLKHSVNIQLIKDGAPTDEEVQLHALTKAKITAIKRVFPEWANPDYETIQVTIKSGDMEGNAIYGSVDDILRAISFQDLDKNYKHWGQKVLSAIKSGKVSIGMTKEQIIMSWGKPHSINRTGGKWGVHEQWVYGDFGPYLYFENNKVTSWQDSR